MPSASSKKADPWNWPLPGNWPPSSNAAGQDRGRRGLRDWVFPSRKRLGPCRRPGSFLWADRRDGRHEVLVPRFAELFHHSGRARPAAATHFDQAAGQPRPAQRYHRGIRGRLDHRTTARTRAGHRRWIDALMRNRGGGSLKLAIGAVQTIECYNVECRDRCMILGLNEWDFGFRKCWNLTGTARRTCHLLTDEGTSILSSPLALGHGRPSDR